MVGWGFECHVYSSDLLIISVRGFNKWYATISLRWTRKSSQPSSGQDGRWAEPQDNSCSAKIEIPHHVIVRAVRTRTNLVIPLTTWGDAV